MDDRANILREMKICRFCLTTEDKELTNIHQKISRDTKQTVPLPLQIMACVAIEVFENDGMPQLICNHCRTQTMHAYTFKTNCKRADDALKVFLHTGQLAKPRMQQYETVTDKSPPPKQFKVVKGTKNLEPNAKRMKMDDGTEIITLNFTQTNNKGTQEQDEDVQEGENEEECILGIEEDTQEGAVTATDDSDFANLEDDSTVNPVLKVNQVKTDCFSCSQCDRTFPLKQLLELHMMNHDRDRQFCCDECDRKFFTKYDLQKHMQTHTGHRPFDCIVCKKSFSREALLRRHEKIHSDVPKYLCTQCDRTFLTKEALDSHAEKHKKKRKYTCTSCDKSFVFKQGLERHLLVHSNEKPHKCNYCEASFNNTIKLTRHITSHAGLRPYPCKLCGRTFLLSHHLTRHMRSHYAAQSQSPEDAIGQHKCDICSMSFRRKDSLINHSAIHSMVNLRCVICNTTFATAKMVKEHITTHLSGLPFPCEKCDYSFETPEQLEEHELKHAEMEYEEQIEKEVISEAKKQMSAEEDSTDDEYDEEHIAEYTINDVNDLDSNLRVTRKSKATKPSYAQFLKEELGSDLEENPTHEDSMDSQEQESLQEPQEPIKPIVRSEGTKVYKRKAPLARRLPVEVETKASTSSITAPVEDITQSPTKIDNLGLSQEIINSLPAKQCVNMKMGEKMVRVQKFIITKEEMKQMAKQGILEMKGGQILLKNAGQSVLNATLKPIQKTDIENLLSQKPKPQLKQYPRKVGAEKAAVGGGETHVNTAEGDVQIRASEIDLNLQEITHTLE